MLAPSNTMALVLFCLVGGAPDEAAELRAQIEDLEAKVAMMRASISEMAETQEEPRRLTSGGVDTLNATMTLQVERIDDVLGSLTYAMDHMWLLITGTLVMFMHAGFAILEAGSCRAKHFETVLAKNMMTCFSSAICWYILGFGFAYGTKDANNSFIGTSYFAGQDFPEAENLHRDWFFQWAFCATAATIVSGAVAERICFSAYVLYAVVMTSLIYPVVVYWTWSGEGFLSEMGYSDFAGSGIVHMPGGFAALTAAALLGPRLGRWENEDSFAPHNINNVVLGTFILWFGWYGFNCGSTLGLSDTATATTAAQVAMNTTLSASSGGITALILRYRSGKIDLAGMCNGLLAGLVAVCAGADTMGPYSAIFVGVLGAAAMELGSVLTKKCGVDDPLDAFAVHGCGGMVGVLMRPLLDRSGFDAECMTAHIAAVPIIIGWVVLLSLAVFLPMKFLNCLRVPEEKELAGCGQAKLADKEPSPKAKSSESDDVASSISDGSTKSPSIAEAPEADVNAQV